MKDGVFSAYSKSCLTRLGLAIAISFLTFFVVFGMSLLVGFLTANDLLFEEYASLVLMGCFLFFFGLILTGVIIWGVVVRQNRNRQLDQAFAALGLQPRNYLLSGRQYAGTYHGRQVYVYFHIAGGRYTRTPVLEIFLRGHFRTRLGIGESNLLTRLGGALTRQQALSVNDPIYEGLLIYPLDENWARNLLTNPFVRSALAHLIGKDTPGVRALVYTPDALSLTIRHFDLAIITPETAQDWLQDLYTLAEQAEKQMPPTITAQTNSIEQKAIANRGALTLPVLVVVFGVLSCVMGSALFILMAMTY
ncbi:MAG: hypothetical protein Fur0022_33820 [Anaerolineales bacterium]